MVPPLHVFVTLTQMAIWYRYVAKTVWYVVTAKFGPFHSFYQWWNIVWNFASRYSFGVGRSLADSRWALVYCCLGMRSVWIRLWARKASNSTLPCIWDKNFWIFSVIPILVCNGCEILRLVDNYSEMFKKVVSRVGIEISFNKHVLWIFRSSLLAYELMWQVRWDFLIIVLRHAISNSPYFMRCQVGLLPVCFWVPFRIVFLLSSARSLRNEHVRFSFGRLKMPTASWSSRNSLKKELQGTS